jgi:hypothetical protein
MRYLDAGERVPETEIIPMHRYVDGAHLRHPALGCFDQVSQAAGEFDSPRRNADKCEGGGIWIMLQDFMGDTAQCARNRVAIHDQDRV